MDTINHVVNILAFGTVEQASSYFDKLSPAEKKQVKEQIFAAAEDFLQKMRDLWAAIN